MDINDFDYNLNEELIAKYPTEKRDESRLLVLDRKENKLVDKNFSNIIDFLNEGDLLIFNNSKVMQARVFGKKLTGAKLEFLIERVINKFEAKTHIKSNRPLKIGSIVIIGKFQAKILEKHDMLYHIKLIDENNTDFWNIMEKYGHIPLPPYMNRKDELSDKKRYQTVYSKNLGSVAAPTAGLHFTKSLLEKIKNKGIKIEFLTLHVGSGTFLPVKVNDINNHIMHSEYIEVSKDLCQKIKYVKENKKRVIAVGTTSVRSLESASLNGEIKEFYGESNIFIYPGKKFNVVDAIITNFHLPKSTLIMLVSAFANKNQILNSYKYAIKQKYRFFSYGDSMLIL